MRCQVDGSDRVLEREAMRDETAKIDSALENNIYGLILQIDRSAVRTNQSLLIDANSGGIDSGFAPLRLRKEHNLATWTGRIDCRADQGIPSNRQNHRIGAA